MTRAPNFTLTGSLVPEILTTYSIRIPGLFPHIVSNNESSPTYLTIICALERYVQTIVNRYKDSSAIFAWELMNEARCLGDLPAGPACAPGTGLLTKWYEQQSDFVRGLYVQFSQTHFAL